MKTFVLCAGEASRLYPFSDLLPKSMLPVGGKPVLRHIVERLAQYDFKDIVLCVNKKQLPIFFDYFENGERFGVSIVYSVSEQPLGTVGEVLNVKDLITDDFLLYFGDELTKIDLNQLRKTHTMTKIALGVGTLALLQNVRSEVGVAQVWSNATVTDNITCKETPIFPQITSFEEKPWMNNVWSGIAILSHDALNSAREGDDFGRDLFPRLIAEVKPLYAYISDAEWYDVGTLSHYRRVQKLAEEGKL